jgi:hypothetical protein
MTLLLNGAAGGWDELAIALIAVGVIWVAVKLAGRKPAAEDGDTTLADKAGIDGEDQDPVPPAAPKSR